MASPSSSDSGESDAKTMADAFEDTDDRGGNEWLVAKPDTTDSSNPSDSEDSEESSDSTTSSVCTCDVCSRTWGDDARRCMETGMPTMASQSLDLQQWWALDGQGSKNTCILSSRSEGPDKTRWAGCPVLHELAPVRVLHKGTNCNLNAPGGPVVVYLGQGVSVLGVVDGSGACTVPPVDIVFLGSSVFRCKFPETDTVVTFTWPKDTHDGGKKTHASSKSRLLVKQSPPICIGRAAGTQSIQCAFGTIDATGSGWTSSQYAIPTLFPAVLTERGVCGLLHMQPAESPLVQRTSMFERGMYDCRDGVCMGYRVLYDEFSGHRRVYPTMSLEGAGAVWSPVFKKRQNSHKPAALRMVPMGYVSARDYHAANFRTGEMSSSERRPAGTWIESSLNEWCVHLVCDDPYSAAMAYAVSVPLLNVAFVVQQGRLLRQGLVVPFRALFVNLVCLQTSAADPVACHNSIAVGLMEEVAACGPAELASMCDIWTMGEICEEVEFVRNGAETNRAQDRHSLWLFSPTGVATAVLYSKVIKLLRARSAEWNRGDVSCAILRRFADDVPLQQKIRDRLVVCGYMDIGMAVGVRGTKSRGARVESPVGSNEPLADPPTSSGHVPRYVAAPKMCPSVTVTMSGSIDSRIDRSAHELLAMYDLPAGTHPIRLHALQTPSTLVVGTRVCVPVAPGHHEPRDVRVMCVIRDPRVRLHPLDTFVPDYLHAECGMTATPTGWCVQLPWSLGTCEWLLVFEYLTVPALVATPPPVTVDSTFISRSVADFRALCTFGTVAEPPMGGVRRKRRKIVPDDCEICSPHCQACGLLATPVDNNDVACSCPVQQRVANWRLWQTAARQWLESHARVVLMGYERLHLVVWTGGLAGLLLPPAPDQAVLNTDAILAAARWQSGSAKIAPSLRWDISSVESVDPLAARIKCVGCTSRTVYHMQDTLEATIEALVTRADSKHPLPIVVPTFLLAARV